MFAVSWRRIRKGGVVVLIKGGSFSEEGKERVGWILARGRSFYMGTFIYESNRPNMGRVPKE